MNKYSTVQTFNTGRTYNGPQILRYSYKVNWADDMGQMFNILMIDDSRGLTYSMEAFTFDDDGLSDADVLRVYDSEQRKGFASQAELVKAGLV